MNQKIAALQRPIIVKPTAGRPDHQIPPRRGICTVLIFDQNDLVFEEPELVFFEEEVNMLHH